MSADHNHGHCHCGCCASMDRRDFMATVGLSALAAPSLTGMVSAAAADQPPPDAKPRVLAVFLHPKVDRYWMGWPGACYDIEAREADYTKTMTDAAEKLGVDLAGGGRADRRHARRRQTAGRVQAVAARRRDPDGHGSAPQLLAARREVRRRPGRSADDRLRPMGVAFTGHLQKTRKPRSASSPPRRTTAGWPPACGCCGRSGT